MRSVSEEIFDGLLSTARLPLQEERRQQVIEATELVYSLADILDTVPLDETPPAASFYAGWE